MWIGVLVQELQGCRKSAHMEHLAEICIRISTHAIHVFLALESWSHFEDVSVIFRRSEGCRRRHCRPKPSPGGGGYVGCGGMGRF